MKKIEFSHDWTYREKNEKNEIAITLPHDAMIYESRSKKSLGIHNIGWFEGKDYIYTKHFFAKEEDKDNCFVLEIEGAYHDANVLINKVPVAYRAYGYTDFYVDMTKYLIFGSVNEIQILTANSDQPNSRWYSGTGLYRPVNLYISKQDHILVDGVKIKTLSIEPAEIEVEVKTNTEGAIQVEIEKDGGVIARAYGNTKQQEDSSDFNGSIKKEEKNEACAKATIRIPVEDARLWSVEDPQLYECRVRFQEDEAIETFGIRTLSWDTQNGISINGKRVILRGACIHHDNGVLGACAYPQAEERKVRILKENGYNALRSAHNPCSKAMLTACDRLGMLMMDEYVDVWYIHKTENDYANHMRKNWKSDLKEMVEKDYNHPSVILYSTGNEVAETAQKEGITLTKSMTEYLHELDQTRPVTCGINIFFNFLSSMGLGVYSDEKAKKESADSIQSSLKEEKKKPVGSEFYNTLAGMFGDKMMKIGATLYPCDLKTKDAFANMDIAGYNYGIFRYKHDQKKYKDRLILGSETFCKDAYLFWEHAKTHPKVVGDFVWAGMDYIGEAGIGAWEYPDYAPVDAQKEGWLTAGSGRIDILGNPNGEALYTKVAFEQTEDMYLSVKPVYQTQKHSPSAWKMTDAIPNWSYRGYNGYKAKVEVYARAYEVELFLNGKSLARKKMKNDCVAYFETLYEDGILSAVAYDEKGNKIKETYLETAGEETVLSLKPEISSVRKEELIYIPISYTDKKGILKPMEKHRISIQVTGGILKGFGNACSYNLDGYQNTVTNTYYGRALAVVMADGTGPVEISVFDKERSQKAYVELKVE